jgi:putative tricarboxylic transport membrane protein
MKHNKIFGLILIVMLGITLVLTGFGNKLASASNKAGKVDFPTKRIEIIVPAGPGGGSDKFARAVARELTEDFGVPINIVCMPGANGAIGLQEMNNRPADGYTIQAVVSTIQTEIALGNIKEPELIKGLALFHEDTYALHVKSGSQYDSIDTLIAEAKKNPGKIKLGGMYTLALDEIVVRKLEKALGIQFNYIPYTQTGKMQADLLGGHIDVIIDEFPPSLELIKANRMTPIIVFAKERLKAFPNVPCSVEKNVDVTDGQLRGFILRSDTPQEIIAIWEAALKKAYNTERYQKYAADNLLNLKEAYMGSEDYDALIRKQVGEYKEIFDQLKKHQDNK